MISCYFLLLGKILNSTLISSMVSEIDIYTPTHSIWHTVDCFSGTTLLLLTRVGKSTFFPWVRYEIEVDRTRWIRTGYAKLDWITNSSAVHGLWRQQISTRINLMMSLISTMLFVWSWEGHILIGNICPRSFKIVWKVENYFFFNIKNTIGKISSLLIFELFI